MNTTLKILSVLNAISGLIFYFYLKDATGGTYLMAVAIYLKVWSDK